MEETKGDPLTNLLDTLRRVGILPHVRQTGSIKDIFECLLERYQNAEFSSLPQRVRHAMRVAESGRRAKAVYLFQELEALRNSTVLGPNNPGPHPF